MSALVVKWAEHPSSFFSFFYHHAAENDEDELVPSFVPRLTVRCTTTIAIAALATASVLSELPSGTISLVRIGYPRRLPANVD